MTTKDSTVVRLPRDVVAKLDDLRGEMSRASFVTALLMATEQLKPTGMARVMQAVDRASITPAAAGSVAAQKPRERAAPKPGDCKHPVNQRLGGTCMICGAKV